ncbi:leucyl aminopeptidase family protein [Idiomarina seosinensis]|uniref:leucyl aminopeptidase family protein n=1 Tax=Idiomarina seosinensis TaxID=281739 RepID=UPI00384ABD77
MSLKQFVGAVTLSSALVAPALADNHLHTSTVFSDQNKNSETRVIFVPEDQNISFSNWSSAVNNAVSRAAAIEEFTGKAAQLTSVVAPEGTQANHLLLAGVGNPAEMSRFEAEKLGAAIAAALNSESETVVFDTRLIGNPGLAAEISARAAHGIDLRNYRFDRYQSEPEARPQTTYHWLVNSPDSAEKHYQASRAIAEGVFVARDITALPGSDGYPKAIVELAQEAMKDLDIEITVVTPEQVEKMGMGLLHSVSQGSQHGSYLLAAHYKGSNDDPVALVGKGNTFDTGGYNLKTSSSSIVRMQTDKAGAGAVIGTVMALAAQKAPVNVVAVAPLSHNLISGSATLPGDVVKAGDGTLVEIVNTDAEGRLILGDGNWYANDTYQPRAIANIATLTGSKVRALGNEYGALFASDKGLRDSIIKAGETTGEKVWEMPLDAYEGIIDSSLADIRNIGSPGVQAGAAFLKHFAGDTPWVHVDMAGDAMVSSATGIHPAGPTGYGVRLLTEWVLQLD